MADKLTDKDKEKAKKYKDAFEAKQELYKLMKKIIYETGMGEEDDDYCKALHLYIGGRELIFDPYYQKLSCDEDEISEFDLETIQKLISEINQRYKSYKRKTSKNKKIAEDIFHEDFNIDLNDLE